MNQRLHVVHGGFAAYRNIKYEGIGKIYGAGYHQVFPLVPFGEWSSMIEWCKDAFGPSGTEENPGVWSINQRWYANGSRLYFKDKKDCEWFMLRWA